MKYYFCSMKSKERVLLGMSGGTDSSVAAMKLQEAGYEVTGVTFRFYEVGGKTEYLEDARALAGRLGICLLYTSPSPRDISGPRMPSSA